LPLQRLHRSYEVKKSGNTLAEQEQGEGIYGESNVPEKPVNASIKELQVEERRIKEIFGSWFEGKT